MDQCVSDLNAAREIAEDDPMAHQEGDAGDLECFFCGAERDSVQGDWQTFAVLHAAECRWVRLRRCYGLASPVTFVHGSVFGDIHTEHRIHG